VSLYNEPRVKSVLRPALVLDAHTNYVDIGMPHDSLTDYINELEERLNVIYVLADKARGGTGQLEHPVTSPPDYPCALCHVKSDLDAILRLTNPLLR
jgi:hypothetical protein